MKESVELGRRVRGEVEQAWDQTNLEVENYIMDKYSGGAEEGGNTLASQHSSSDDLDHNLRQLEKTLKNLEICFSSKIDSHARPRSY